MSAGGRHAVGYTPPPPSALRRTAALPDGSMTISPDDAPLVLAALAHAIAYLGTRIGTCRRCGPGVPCSGHGRDYAQANAYRSLGRSLGDGRW